MRLARIWLAATVALIGALIANSATAGMNGGRYCAKLQPLLQPFVKVKLTLHQASDSKTDDMHIGELAYVDCDFRQPNYQIDVSLHDDADKLFDDPKKQGYAALPGFGDRARYSTRGAMGMLWVDVVRGSTACEVRFSDAQLAGDWKQAGGKMCEAAFSVR